MAASDGDPEVPKIYDHARRFEHGGDDLFVELYWDNNKLADGKTYVRRISGSTETSTRSTDQPELVVAEHYYEDVSKSVQEIVQKLLREGYEEEEHFRAAHKLHLPCFTWILSDEAPPSLDVTTSRIGGTPAVFPDELWPKDMQFLFQINLATVPPRLQIIAGTKGLLQLFWSIEEGECDGFARVIPDKFFPLLKAASDSAGPKPEAITAGSPDLAYITGWVERNDYCHRSVGDDEEYLENVLDKLEIRAAKFGGYSGEDVHENKSCQKCGKAHFFPKNQFHAFPGVFGMEDVGDVQALCVEYCPLDVERIEGGKPYFEALAYTSDF